MFNKEFDFVKLGIGGLDEQFNYIFRRAFASRIWPSHVVKSMGINHCRGMLLYGPPGCGKTLIARQIGKALNSHPPKIVNGPEILDKYVGGSEEKIRALFADAEKEQQAQGGEGAEWSEARRRGEARPGDEAKRSEATSKLFRRWQGITINLPLPRSSPAQTRLSCISLFWMRWTQFARSVAPGPRGEPASGTRS